MFIVEAIFVLLCQTEIINVIVFNKVDYNNSKSVIINATKYLAYTI